MMLNMTRRTFSTKGKRIIGSLIVFCCLVAGILGIAFFLTQKIDYVWRWYLIPRYFVSHESRDIRTQIDGIVEKISRQGDTVTIHIQGESSRQAYHISSHSVVAVSEGDHIVQDTLLGTSKTWSVGILLQGLWVTLQISAIASVFGIIIGVVGGLMLQSDIPLLRWLIILYMEVIRGIPLLWQIFLWYYVFGTLINHGLHASGFPSIPPFWFGVVILALYAGANITHDVRHEIQRRPNSPSTQQSDVRGDVPSFPLLRTLVSILPKLSEQLPTLIKDSSLLSLLAIGELTKASRETMARSLQLFEVTLTCVLVYFVVVFTLSKTLGIWSTRIANKYAK